MTFNVETDTCQDKPAC